jgi:hypothetical protein
MQALKYIAMVVSIVIALLVIGWIWVRYGPQLVTRSVHSAFVTVPHHK